MSIATSLLPEFDQEMAGARRVLERVPGNRMDWRPHEKSMTLGGLAAHLAAAPGWIAPILERPGMDLAPSGGRSRPAEPTTPEGILELFDGNVATARKALAAASDGAFPELWTLRAGPQVIYTLPRTDIYRRFGISHLVHHRAQLGVYLRLLDIPVPGVYGPSADET
jgi:uncharacterized damage-inducible protein DinB